MNATQVVKLNGTAATAGFVTWSVPVPGGSPRNSFQIRCAGGFYWLLLNITINNVQSMSNEVNFQWNQSGLTPQILTVSTRAHTHQIGGVNSSAGPRLVYQSPLQFISYGQIAAGQQVALEAFTPCSVELIAIRHSVIEDFNSFAMEMR